jgi:uncharacterized protein YdhG (YjbR/CyaY superfamily)
VVQGHVVEVLYRGQPVEREVYASVEDARGIVPWPTPRYPGAGASDRHAPPVWEVTHWQLDLVLLLKELGASAGDETVESYLHQLKWNLPVYVRGEKTNLWMLQNFKNHCSLRFPPPFFATQKAAVTSAGYEAGEGFIKLPYERELPTELLKALMQARVEEYTATGAGWNDR